NFSFQLPCNAVFIGTCISLSITCSRWWVGCHPCRIYQVYRILVYVVVWCPTNKLLRQRVNTYKNTNSWVVVSCSIIIHSGFFVHFLTVKLVWVVVTVHILGRVRVYVILTLVMLCH